MGKATMRRHLEWTRLSKSLCAHGMKLSSMDLGPVLRVRFEGAHHP